MTIGSSVTAGTLVVYCSSMPVGAVVPGAGIFVDTLAPVKIGMELSTGSLVVEICVGATVDIFLQANVPISLIHTSSCLQLSIFCEHSSISINANH